MTIPPEIETILRSRTRKVKVSRLLEILPDLWGELRWARPDDEIQLDYDPEFEWFIIQIA